MSICSKMLTSTGAEDAPIVRLLQKLFDEAVEQQGLGYPYRTRRESSANPPAHRRRAAGTGHERGSDCRRPGAAPETAGQSGYLGETPAAGWAFPDQGQGTHQVDVRLSTMPVAQGESVVMRLLDQTSGILSFDELGMPDAIRQRLRGIIRRPHGMLLVTGPDRQRQDDHAVCRPQ